MDVYIVLQIEDDGWGYTNRFIVGVTATRALAEKVRDFYQTAAEDAGAADGVEWEITAYAVQGATE